MKIELIAKHEKDSRACRDAFALTLKDMMAADKSVCYVDCDLMGCVNTKQLMAAYPDRALEAGIAEANAAGVCAGLAEYFAIDPTLVRLAWVLFCALGGSGVLAYIICALIIPSKSQV